MDLRRLKYFCTVVEQGSLTQASKVLHVAQPALSTRLKELEEELDVVLFSRHGRRIEPTAAGYHLYQRAGDILRDVESAARETAFVAKQQSRVLRLGLSHLYQNYFEPLIFEIHRRLPAYEFVISVSDSSHLEFMLATGGLDLGLMQKPRHGVGFDCIELPAVETIAVAPRSFDLARHGDPVPFVEIGRYPLVMLRRSNGSGISGVFLEHFRRGGVNPRVVMQISQPPVILDWLGEGLEAVALLPASEVRHELPKGCAVHAVSNSPVVFSPSVVKMTNSPHLPEIQSLLEGAAGLVKPLAPAVATALHSAGH